MAICFMSRFKCTIQTFVRHNMTAYVLNYVLTVTSRTQNITVKTQTKPETSRCNWPSMFVIKYSECSRKSG